MRLISSASEFSCVLNNLENSCLSYLNLVNIVAQTFRVLNLDIQVMKFFFELNFVKNIFINFTQQILNHEFGWSDFATALTLF